MRGHEPEGKNHSTERDCPKVENASGVPSGTTVSANGDGCLGTVQDRPADDYEDHFEDEGDEDDLAELNCGEMPEGGCSLAGTEWCDWSCPFSDEMMKRASAAQK